MSFENVQPVAGQITPVVSITDPTNNRKLIVNADGSINVTGGAGGGGGPATIADGADVAEGATTDVAVVSDANGTLSGKLRGLVKILADVWDSVNHRLKVDGSGVTQPVSGTVSVGTVPVTGTFFQGTQPVSIASMPSTPVTGAFFQATQPVSAVSLPLPANATQETGGNLALMVALLQTMETLLQGQREQVALLKAILVQDGTMYGNCVDHQQFMDTATSLQ